jgi:preprotein translocase subunit SecE
LAQASKAKEHEQKETAFPTRQKLFKIKQIVTANTDLFFIAIFVLNYSL